MSSLNQVAQVVAEELQLETKGVAAQNILDREIISCPRNASDISLSKPDKNNPFDYSRFTDDELVRAVELMISPDDLTIREVAEALLKTLCYTSAEIAVQLAKSEYLNEGAVFDLHTQASRSIA